jgi:hypothetical protein
LLDGYIKLEEFIRMVSSCPERRIGCFRCTPP